MWQTLFEQTRAGQVLTAAGEALLIHVKQMHVTAEQIREAPNGLPSRPDCCGSAFPKVSARGSWPLNQFHCRYLDITIDIAATTGFLSPSKREADLAILLARPLTDPVVSGKLTDYRMRRYSAATYLASGVFIPNSSGTCGRTLRHRLHPRPDLRT